jgi:tripartite-type tricarboxylate transporter receptor subunit TctC
MKKRIWMASPIMALAIFGAQPADAKDSDATSFYKNRDQMQMIISARPGGSYDTYARLLARHIGAHIPGDPSIVSINKPGASGIKAANYVAKEAPHDGSVLTNIRYNFAMYQALGALDAVPTDIRDFNWLGSFNATNHVLVTWYDSPVKTLADAEEKQVLIGQSSPRSAGTLMCDLYNAFLGTKFKVVTGYGGLAKIKLAMQRGEVQGLGSDGWSDLKADFSDFLEKKQLNIIIQVGLEKESELPDVPLLLDQARDQQEKAVFDFITKSESSIGKPFATSPGVPADRVALLRTAFDKTMKDKAFLKDADKLHVEVHPVSGKDVQQIVADIIGAPESVTKKMRAVLGIEKGQAIQ